MTRVFVDTVGGDKDKHGLEPYERIVPAVRSFVNDNPYVEVTLGGDEELLRRLTSDEERITVVPGRRTLANIKNERRDTALYKGMVGLDKGGYDSVFTAGDTRAAVLYASTVVGRMPGVRVTPLIARLPTALPGKMVTFMDAGASTNSFSEQLVELVRIAHAYTKVVEGITVPRVGLLSNGHEEYKGSREVREAHNRLAGTKGIIDYVGQCEPEEYIRGGLDAIVGCGFLMNGQLKLIEALLTQGGRVLKEEISGLTVIEQALAYLGMRRIKGRIKKRFSHEEHSGALLLAKRPIIKDHGTASRGDVINSLRLAKRYTEEGLLEAVQEEVSRTIFE